jgi:hypothetical protein
MLTVKVTDAKGELVGMLEIRNNGDLSTAGDDSPEGSYDYTLWRRSDVGQTGRVANGRLERFDRTRGAWALVKEILNAEEM